MSALSSFLESALLNTLRGTSFVKSTLYLALYTTATTDAAPGTEIVDTAYARQIVSFTAPTKVDDKTVIKNSSEIVYQVATRNWGNVTHFAIMDAVTAGNMMFHGPLSSVKNIETGDQIRFPVNAINLYLG